MPGTIRLVDPDGVERDVPVDAAATALQDPRWRLATTEDTTARISAQAREAEYGGAGGALKAGAASLARGATLGLSDVAARAIGGEQARIDLEGLSGENPGISTAGEFVGAIGPTLISGGAAAPSSFAGATGRAVSRRVGGGIAGAAAGGAVEGGIFGVGQGVSELALSRDPLTAERVASTLSSNALFGASTGGAAGAVGSLVERGLAKASKVLDERLAARAAADAVAPDLATLDAKGLRAARDAEVEQLSLRQATSRAEARSSVVDDVLTYRREVKDANPWLVINEGEEAAKLNKAGRALRGALDDPKGLRSSPGPLLRPLRIEEQALEGAVARRAEIAARLDETNAKIARGLSEELATLPDAATHVELSGRAARRYAAFADVKVGKDAVVEMTRDEAKSFLGALGSGEVTSASRESLDKLESLLARNRELQAKIEGAVAPLTPRSELVSERLSAIDAARDALAMPKMEPPLVARAASGALFGTLTGAAASIPLIGQIPGVAHLIGAKGAETISGLVFGRLERGAGVIAERTKAAVDAFAGATKAANKYAPVLATKVLAGTRFAPARRDEEREQTLPALFKARTDEIKSQTAYDETGTPRIRPEARAAVAQVLRPVAAVDPIAADRLETIAVRRIEFLSSKVPRRPDFGMPLIGPDRWHPSDMEMRSFARTVAAVEDPDGVEDRALHGTLTPEDAEAYWAVYPERARHFQQSILEHPELGKTLTYRKRLTLSLLTGEPLDPSMNPEVLAVLQGQFVTEPGTEGGMQAPRAMPQFGSVRNLAADVTPSQSRAQGASL